MSCFEIKSIDGNTRKVEVPLNVSVPLSPGEVLVNVTPSCDGSIVVGTKPNPGVDQTALLVELNEKVGSGAGDWIKTLVKPFAALVGRKNCTVCEARRIATNAYAKLVVIHGKEEAVRILKELWTMSMSQSGEAVLEKLKGYLECNG